MEEDKREIRINKAMALAGLCSRRRADELIAAGAVRLNGELVSGPGLKVREGDVLFVEGKSVTVRLKSAAEFVYLMLNKPTQVVSTASDPEGRPTVLDLLPPKYSGTRLFPVGRLDYFSEGLILLTNDGPLTQRLTHPRFHLPKHYEVLIRGDISEAQLGSMRSGMTLAEGERLAPVEVKRLACKQGTLLSLTLHQGINRQIRRMCRDLGLTILRLCRVGQGSLKLGGLESGQCRPLSQQEVNILKKEAGL